MLALSLRTHTRVSPTLSAQTNSKRRPFQKDGRFEPKSAKSIRAMRACHLMRQKRSKTFMDAHDTCACAWFACAHAHVHDEHDTTHARGLHTCMHACMCVHVVTCSCMVTCDTCMNVTASHMYLTMHMHVCVCACCTCIRTCMHACSLRMTCIVM